MRACTTVFLLVLAVVAGTGGVADARAAIAEPTLDLAVMDAPAGISLDDILSGRARSGFTPLLTPGFPLPAQGDRVLWVRVRADLPPGASGRWNLVMPRVPVDRMRLRVYPPGEVVARDSFFVAGSEREPWPSNFILPLPEGRSGPVELYLELETHVDTGVHLRLLDTPGAVALEASARSYFRLVYSLFLLVAVLSVIRHVEDPRVGALAIGASALCGWLACLGLNGHLYSLPEVARLAEVGALVPQALAMLAAGTLVLASRHFSGVSKSSPALSLWSAVLGWLLVAAAAASLFLPAIPPVPAQRVAWVGAGLAVGASLLMLLMDSRNTRWAALATLSLVVLAVVLRVLADLQQVPAGLWTLYGWQLALAATTVLYLALPWIRARLQARAIRKRAVPPEPTAEEKIAQARERLVHSLQGALKNAADGDMQWIAFRRLLDGLKPILPQTSAAVVAFGFHGDDLLQVEPADAEPRYRELLSQRETLLKNLSRLRAPQQIGIDFDGPQGPLDQVQLALIPLPVAKPGWGALLVERNANVTYSDAELALCAEFAAMAYMAGDEASGAVSDQRKADTDPATGLLRQEALHRQLVQAMESARLKQTPLSLLYVRIDQVPALREAGGEVGVIAGMRPVVDLLRAEMDHGDVIGRHGADDFLLVATGKRLLPSREYADRLRTAVSHLAVDPRISASISISVGIAHAGPDEKDAAAFVGRAANAAQIASKNGGNQIFS